MTAEKKQKREAVRYEVEWCASIPVDENGDRDFDRAKYRRRHFPTLPLAVTFARKLLADRKDNFGCVPIHLERLDVDADILANEGIRVVRWEAVDKWVVDDENPAVEPDHVGLPASY